MRVNIINDPVPNLRPLSKRQPIEKSSFRLLATIVSGGQTGVDRAALDAAIALDIEHGGWCPRGRIAEDGPLRDCYRLREHPSPKYSDRTKRNVQDSDATLVLYRSVLEGGTLRTIGYAQSFNKPCIKVQLTQPGSLQRVREWIATNRVQTLNVAGPRASKEPDIYEIALDYLIELLQQWRRQPNTPHP